MILQLPEPNPGIARKLLSHPKSLAKHKSVGGKMPELEMSYLAVPSNGAVFIINNLPNWSN